MAACELLGAMASGGLGFCKSYLKSCYEGCYLNGCYIYKGYNKGPEGLLELMLEGCFRLAFLRCHETKDPWGFLTRLVCRLV